MVFGINSSPFQGQFVSQTYAEKHKDELPLAAEAVSKSTYMDDSMDSVLDDSQGIELYKQLDELWNKVGMQAHKWLSNSPRSREDTNQGQSIQSGHHQGSPTNSKDTGNHVASRGRKVHVQSKSA